MDRVGVLIVGFVGLAGIRLAVDGIPELATFAANEEVLSLVSLIPLFVVGGGHDALRDEFS